MGLIVHNLIKYELELQKKCKSPQLLLLERKNKSIKVVNTILTILRLVLNETTSPNKQQSLVTETIV